MQIVFIFTVKQVIGILLKNIVWSSNVIKLKIFSYNIPDKSLDVHEVLYFQCILGIIHTIYNIILAGIATLPILQLANLNLASV